MAQKYRIKNGVQASAFASAVRFKELIKSSEQRAQVNFHPSEERRLPINNRRYVAMARCALIAPVTRLEFAIMNPARLCWQHE